MAANLPDICINAQIQSHHTFHLIEGDATNLENFEDNNFDIAFSNSVIEHVGAQHKQMQLVREITRLAPLYWVQTPAIWFALESHTGIPFWFILPKFVRSQFHKSWSRRYPEWNIMVLGTTVISRSTLKKYFPEAQFWTEKLFMLPKSYIVYKNRTNNF